MRVYFDFYAPDFPKKYFKYFKKLSTFESPFDQLNPVDTDFVSGVKCLNFWLHRGLRAYFDLYAPDFPKK